MENNDVLKIEEMINQLKKQILEKEKQVAELEEQLYGNNEDSEE